MEENHIKKDVVTNHVNSRGKRSIEERAARNETVEGNYTVEGNSYIMPQSYCLSVDIRDNITYIFYRLHIWD